ncbi:hypothetical protein FRC12_001464 [Ceratobasidium sp. 428]|nr:hypothetical protein FRC12_001464 [Ceratobasidium sp. 428]
MILFPETQKRAQKEIDSLTGGNRLPCIKDAEHLPYVNRLIREVFRWQPAAPLAIPHACYEDDVYRGYQIPKGTPVIGNVWAITRDESTYPDPETFNPDRFLDVSVPSAPGFGWGRRRAKPFKCKLVPRSDQARKLAGSTA